MEFTSGCPMEFLGWQSHTLAHGGSGHSCTDPGTTSVLYIYIGINMDINMGVNMDINTDW